MTWLDDYTAWALQRSPLTPKHFHENIGLSLLAGAVAGRVVIQLPHERLTPNLWTLIVATTSIYAKSTALKVAQQVIDLTMQEKTFNSVATPEALMAEFSGAKPGNLKDLDEDKQQIWNESAKWGARRLLIMDEAGRFFNALQREYNQTLDSILMESYDASGKPIVRQTMRGGLVIVERACLSCLFATTPANVRTLLSSRDQWSSGWWPRWNFVTARELTAWKEADYGSPPPAVVDTLRRISRCDFEQSNDKEYHAQIDKSVISAYNEATKTNRNTINAIDDDKQHGMISRLPTKRMKAALLFAIMESSQGKVHVKLSHWMQTEGLVNGWTEDAQLAITLSAQTERLSLEEKVLGYIKAHHHAQGITARKITQFTNRTAQEIDGVLQTFIRNGTVISVERGRTKVFLLAAPELNLVVAEVPK